MVLFETAQALTIIKELSMILKCKRERIIADIFTPILRYSLPKYLHTRFRLHSIHFTTICNSRKVDFVCHFES